VPVVQGEGGAEPSGRDVRRSLALLLSVASAVVALDWWTKRWATEHLARHEPVEIVGELVRFTYTRNSGVAFGLGAGLPFPYYVFSIVAVAAILFLFLRRAVHSFPRQLALSLILGGAIGNLIDRLMLGEVVDFIEIGWGHWHWPVFNVADSAVTIGVVLFGLTWTRSRDAETEAHVDAPVAMDPSRSEPAAVGGPGIGANHESDTRALGPSAEQRGATGPLSGGSSGRPLS